MARRIELRNVGDFRRLPEELEEFDAAKLDVARVELWQRCVTELLLDPGDVLLDPGCG